MNSLDVLPRELTTTTRRQRVPRACESCRKRKIKCDGLVMCQNCCQICSASPAKCEYLDTARHAELEHLQSAPHPGRGENLITKGHRAKPSKSNPLGNRKGRSIYAKGKKLPPTRLSTAEHLRVNNQDKSPRHCLGCRWLKRKSPQTAKICLACGENYPLCTACWGPFHSKSDGETSPLLRRLFREESGNTQKEFTEQKKRNRRKRIGQSDIENEDGSSITPSDDDYVELENDDGSSITRIDDNDEEL